MTISSIENYIQGWIDGDIEKVLRVLSENCGIIESHGPKFVGKEQVRIWMNGWKERGGEIREWKVIKIVQGDDAAAIEWEFECLDRGREYKFSGASIITFQDGLICRITEYMRTQKPCSGIEEYT